LIGGWLFTRAGGAVKINIKTDDILFVRFRAIGETLVKRLGECPWRN